MYTTATLDEQIERDVVEGERQLANQEMLIVELKRQSQETTKAEAELDRMRADQRLRNQDRQRLLSRLHDSASSPVPGSSAVALSGRSRPAVLLINPGAMKLLVREDIVLRSLTILGGRHMADPIRHLWTPEEIEKLRAMAGNHRREKIAAELNRGAPAVALKAHQLGISLRYHAMPKRRPSTAESAPRK